MTRGPGFLPQVTYGNIKILTHTMAIFMFSGVFKMTVLFLFYSLLY